MRRLTRLFWCACVLSISSCNKQQTKAETDAAVKVEPGGAGLASAAEPVTFDLIAALPGCTVKHRGLSIDVGTRAADYARSYAVGPFLDVTNIDREGATFGRIRAKKIAYEFWLEEPLGGLIVSVRAHGAVARTMNVQIDDKRAGTVKLSANETRIVTLPSLPTELAAGRHSLTLRFAGKMRNASDAYVELDWIRLGVADEIPATYAAPTLRDIVSEDVVLGNRPKRSIVLRAPSTVRCPMRVAPHTELRVSVGFWGAGRGTAEIRAVSEDEPPVTLAQRKISGGVGATWTPLTVDLGRFVTRVIGLELRALETSRGGRIAFGDPVIARSQPESELVPRANNVVLVIAAGLNRRYIPPWGPIGALGTLGELSRNSAAFASLRAPTSVPAAAVASMLSGMQPRSHALHDQAARLPDKVRSLGELLKEASGRTAMFTGVPTTFAAFGFNTGWDHYEMLSPVQDLPAHEPYVLAAKWLENELAVDDSGQRLVVVHVRGAHPPWDLSREEVAKLKPDDYNGPLDARRGAITLANVRARKLKSQRRLADDDWTRLHELSVAALGKQNAGLAQLLNSLKKAGAWDDTLFIFVGDVAAGEAPEMPFEPVGPLTEDRLLLPLLVKFPGGKFAGKEIATAVSSIDITRTIIEALRLKLPPQVTGLDLYAVASGREPLVGRPLCATLGNQYATRSGNWLLQGEFGKVPKLCQLDVDPACVTDVLQRRPLAARASWQWTFDEETSTHAPEGRSFEREPASIDPETAAALTVWGDIY